MATTRTCTVSTSTGSTADVQHIFVHASGHVQTVKAAWVKTAAGNVEQWWPPLVAGHPPGTGSGGHVVHTATAGAHAGGGHVKWSIPSSRHVKTQRLTITNTHGLHAAGKLNGHPFGLDHGKSFTITVSAGTRSVTLTTTAGDIGRASVRYTYT